MSTIALQGDVGPLEALDLRDRLERAISIPRPRVHVDLTKVLTMHPAAVVAIVTSVRRARRRAGTVTVLPPTGPDARHLASQVSLDRLLR